MYHEILEFKVMGDERGSLIALEQQKDIPFDIKRVYYIFDTKEGVVRGNHAHRTIQQVVVCLSGSCKFILDDGKERKEILLNRRDEGLLLTKPVWREMYDFSPDCVLMVLASDYYDPEEYIRNYQDFIKLVKEREQSQ